MPNIKICLDAGHFGKNNWNPNVTPTYWESLMAWELHEYLASELARYEGITTIKTRTDEATDLDLTARGKKAAGCDLFLSVHSNACDTESVDRAVVIFPISGKCKDLAQKLADCITSTMTLKDKPQIYQKVNSAGNADYYGVIRGAAAVGVPGLILEHSFHTHNKSAVWLQSSANLKKLAAAEAAVIAAYYGCKLRQTAAPAPAPKHPFVDVPASAWYAPDVQWAWENGITDGTDKTHFSPDETVTRAQMVTLLRRLAGMIQK